MNVVGIGMVELLLVLGLGGGAGLPLGMPPAPEDPLMAQVAPNECLFYTTWAGTAEPDPASKNQTEQLLAEPEILSFVAGIERFIERAAEQAAGSDDTERAAAADAVRWGKKLLTSPTALFVASITMVERNPDIRAGALVCVGKEDAPALTEVLDKYMEMLPPEVAETVRIAGVDWHRLTLDPDAPQITLGVRDDYFIVGVGEGSLEGILARTVPPSSSGGSGDMGVSGVLARPTAPMPDWLAKVRQQLPVDRTATVTYVNVEKLLEFITSLGPSAQFYTFIEAVGLTNVNSVASVTGLGEEGAVNRGLIALDGPPQGLLGLAAAKPLGPADLAPIPADATVAAAVRLDASRALNLLMSVLDPIDSRSREELIQGLNQIRDELKVDVQGDVLDSLGDAWCFYNSPGEGGLVVTGLTGVVGVKDHKRLAEAQAKLVAAMKAELDEKPDRGPRIEQFEFAGQTVYVFNSREDGFPLAPAWCLTDKELIAATFPQNVKAYLTRGADFESLAKTPAVAAELAGGNGPLTFAYVDVPAVFEIVYPMVPMLGQLATSALTREGIDVNVSILPSAPAIGKHLRPGTMSVRRTEAGIEWTSRQTLPGGGLGTLAPIALGLFLPAISF